MASPAGGGCPDRSSSGGGCSPSGSARARDDAHESARPFTAANAHPDRRTPTSVRPKSSCAGILLTDSRRVARGELPACLGYVRHNLPPTTRLPSGAEPTSSSEIGSQFKYRCVGYAVYDGLAPGASTGVKGAAQQLPYCNGMELITTYQDLVAAAEAKDKQGQEGPPHGAGGRGLHQPVQQGAREVPAGAPASAAAPPGGSTGAGPAQPPLTAYDKLFPPEYRDLTERTARIAGLVLQRTARNLEQIAGSLWGGRSGP